MPSMDSPDTSYRTRTKTSHNGWNFVCTLLVRSGNEVGWARVELGGTAFALVGVCIEEGLNGTRHDDHRAPDTCFTPQADHGCLDGSSGICTAARGLG